jgi:hypothetical protein
VCKSVILSASVAAQARGELPDRFIVSANRKIAGHEVEAQTRGYFGESPRLGSPVLHGPCSAFQPAMGKKRSARWSAATAKLQWIKASEKVRLQRWASTIMVSLQADLASRRSKPAPVNYRGSLSTRTRHDTDRGERIDGPAVLADRRPFNVGMPCGFVFEGMSSITSPSRCSMSLGRRAPVTSSRRHLFSGNDGA